ncbi:hypothetical protein AURDEDRAFT_173648 [Auricularia subglabra TFB-10046 SS5]|nr:hypothetical protein AURDEDRAFT_173648 [Auricularia subglabra TFB-10046 SS5]
MTETNPYAQAIDKIWDLVEDDSGKALTPARWMEANDPPYSAISCVKYEPQSSFRIVHGDSELAFKLVGIVDRRGIPPFERKLTSQSHLTHLLQLIGIVGASSARFAANAEALATFVRVASRTIPYTVDRNALSNLLDGVTASTRLFSRKDYANEQDVLPLPYLIDPTGELAAVAAGADLVHLEENEVEYLQLVNGMHVRIAPASIQRGDIVELRVSVVFFHTSKTSLAPKLELRAVISHDTSLSNAYQSRGSQQDTSVVQPVATGVVRRLKRVRVESDASAVTIIANKKTKHNSSGEADFSHE